MSPHPNPLPVWERGQSAVRPINPAVSRNPKPPALAGGVFTSPLNRWRKYAHPCAHPRDSLAAAAPSAILGTVFVDLERLILVGFAVEAGDGGTRFMALHLNKTKSLALAAKHIYNQFNGAHLTKLRKQLFDIGFGRVRGYAANK